MAKNDALNCNRCCRYGSTAKQSRKKAKYEPANTASPKKTFGNEVGTDSAALSRMPHDVALRKT
jgi:hypothetical protein